MESTASSQSAMSGGLIETLPLRVVSTQQPMISSDIMQRRQLNEAAPISRLPPELIADILFHCREISLRLDDGNPSMGGHWDSWVPVTHVCHHWRTISLSIPILWDHIYAWREDITMEWLARSRGVPIDVKVDDWDGEALLPMLLQQLPRIRSLDLDIFRSYRLTADDPWVGHPAPHLQSVSTLDGDAFVRPTFVELLLRSHMPSLQSFCVSDISWNWTGSTLPTTLTSLHISPLSWLCSREIGSNALSVLGKLPLLESLHLTDESYDDVTEDNAAETTILPCITLPKLQDFRFVGPPLICFHLLDHVSVPSKCKLRLELSTMMDTPARIDELSVVFNRAVLMNDVHLYPVTVVSIRGYCEESFEMHCWKMSPTAVSPTATDPPNITLTFADFNNVQASTRFIWGSLMYGVVGGMTLTQTRTLDIFETHRHPETLSYRHVLRHMSNIEDLRVHNWTISALLSLIPTRLNLQDENSEELFLPHLREMTLEGVSFPLLPATLEDQQYVEYFFDRLRTRRERSAGFTTLVLRSCFNLTESLVEAMSREVGIVQWDGIQRPGTLWEDMGEDFDFEELI